jgi:hypothetical protein
MVDVGHATIAPTPTHSRANSHTQLRLHKGPAFCEVGAGCVKSSSGLRATSAWAGRSRSRM